MRNGLSSTWTPPNGRIPAHKTKMREVHLVPLAEQALRILL